ncbi:MAG TPA: biotin/lipoyl-containing protein, partial [Frankiaceae bacterium]|nr:biotin/lipoyl-containing protein [Frankiaceae bacterium]
MATRDFRLPDLGEGLTEGEILQWLVRVGDEVRLNQPIVEVETAKAAVEVPSPYAGVVTALHHEAGETVAVGTPIISFETGPGAPSPVAELAAGAAAADPHESVAVVAEEAMVGTPRPDEPVEPGIVGGPAPGGRASVLVGYGPRP